MLQQTKEFLKEHWKTIAVTVVASIIFAFICWIAKFIVLLRVIFKEAMRYCSVDVTVQRWVMCLIFFGGVFLLWMPLKLRSILQKKRLPYCTDEVKGLIWEWDNYGYGTEINSLKAFCPKCQAELSYVDNYNNKGYSCHICGFKKAIRCGDYKAKDLIRIEVEKRERTGDWKNYKKRLKNLQKV